MPGDVNHSCVAPQTTYLESELFDLALASVAFIEVVCQIVFSSSKILLGTAWFSICLIGFLILTRCVIQHFSFRRFIGYPCTLDGSNWSISVLGRLWSLRDFLTSCWSGGDFLRPFVELYRLVDCLCRPTTRVLILPCNIDFCLDDAYKCSKPSRCDF